ncbi:MAG: hypothetical protein ACRD0A_08415 [Acidimicrobiales bacterium]
MTIVAVLLAVWLPEPVLSIGIILAVLVAATSVAHDRLGASEPG